MMSDVRPAPIITDKRILNNLADETLKKNNQAIDNQFENQMKTLNDLRGLHSD